MIINIKHDTSLFSKTKKPFISINYLEDLILQICFTEFVRKIWIILNVLEDPEPFNE